MFVAKSGSLAEPLADEWERQALCALGVDYNRDGDGVDGGIMVKVPGTTFAAGVKCEKSTDASAACVVQFFILRALGTLMAQEATN